MTDLYARNLEQLKRRGSILYDMVRTAGEPDGVEFLAARDGSPTLRVTSGDSGKILLHSAYDPVKEAGDMLAKLDLKQKNVVFVLGFGLGYHVEALMDRCPWVKTIVVLEADPVLLKAAARHRDLSRILGSENVMLICGDNPHQLIDYLSAWQGRILTGNIHFMPHQPSLTLHPRAYDGIRKALRDTFTTLHVNTSTNLLYAHVIQKNLVENIPEVLRSYGINRLKDSFKGRPAVCVNSGPSLANNIDLLHELKGKALIIAIDSVVRVLLEKGIVPDIVCTIDYLELNYLKFEGLFDRLKDNCLVFDPECCPRIVREFQGKKVSFAFSKPLYAWLSGYIEDKGSISKTMCVSHLALLAAAYMGADPVALIGQDLSYPQAGISHVKGTSFKSDVSVFKDNRTGKDLFLFRDEHFGNAVREALPVEDVNGDTVYTDVIMKGYINFYERLLQTMDSTCIQASESGAKIDGAQIMPLRQVIDRYCSGTFDAQPVLDAAFAAPPLVRAESLVQAVRKLVVSLREMNGLAEKGDRIINELLDDFKKKSGNIRRQQELAGTSNAIKDRLMEMMSGALAGAVQSHTHANVFLVNRSDKLPTGDLSERDKRYRMLERASIFYTGIEQATRDLGEAFGKTLERLEAEYPDVPAAGDASATGGSVSGSLIQQEIP